MTAPFAVTVTLPFASDLNPLNVVERGSAFRATVGPVFVASGKPVLAVVVGEGALVDVGLDVVVLDVVELDVVDVELGVGAAEVVVVALAVRVFFGAQAR